MFMFFQWRLKFGMVFAVGATDVSSLIKCLDFCISIFCSLRVVEKKQ